MNIVVRSIRKAGLAPIIKWAARTAGYELWPRSQYPAASWLGLPTYPIRTVLDIGAYDGGWASGRLRPAFPAAVIHSFEPSPRMFPRLKETADKSNGKIIPHNFALGECTKSMTLNMTVDAPAASSLLPTTRDCQHLFPLTARAETETVDVKALDDIAGELAPAIEEELLVKMDVQGFEDRVIRGGRRTLSRARACIMEVQAAHLYEGQPTFRDLFVEMESLGLSFAGTLEQYLDDAGRVVYFDAVFIKF